MSLPFIPTSEIEGAYEGQDYRLPLDLNQLLIERPAATFLLRSDSRRYGLSIGDILVVERGAEPRDYQLVVAVSHGELVLGRAPAREVWGVVRYVIQQT